MLAIPIDLWQVMKHGWLMNSTRKDRCVLSWTIVPIVESAHCVGTTGTVSFWARPSSAHSTRIVKVKVTGSSRTDQPASQPAVRLDRRRRSALADQWQTALKPMLHIDVFSSGCNYGEPKLKFQTTRVSSFRRQVFPGILAWTTKPRTSKKNA